MPQTPHKSPLEEFYEDDAWRRDVKDERLNRLNKKLWKVVLGFIIGYAALGLVVGIYFDPKGLGDLAFKYLVVIFFCFIAAAVIAAVLAVIPHKDYAYYDRTQFWLPALLVLIGGLGVLMIILNIITVLNRYS